MEAIIRDFVKASNDDVIKYNNKKFLRPHARDVILKDKDVKLRELVRSTPKKPFTSEYVINKTLIDPFDTLGIEHKTPVQEFMCKHIRLFPVYQAFLYTTSCGAGKTLAGLYAISQLECKTLIISTRNAINDQWKTSIEKCFPTLKICTLSDDTDENDADIYIYSPQYLAKKFETTNIKVSLIIYDEIHSLVSDVFSKVIEGPYKLVMSGKWEQLPYFIGLSATLPQTGSEDRKVLDMIFGKPFAPKANVTSIPIHVWDYRNIYTKEERGGFDLAYDALSDNECVRYFVDKISSENSITPSKEYKGMVITYTIDSSVWAGLYIHKVWNVNVLIIRAANERCMFLEKDKGLDYAFEEDVKLSDLSKDIEKVGCACSMKDKLSDSYILCGCFHRLKEGFSVENCTWGIITRFVWAIESRVQVLGRIRRYSLDDKLNKHKRMFYVCSGRIPNNLYTLSKKYHKPYRQVMPLAKIEYDLEYEREVYKKENIIMDN